LLNATQRRSLDHAYAGAACFALRLGAFGAGVIRDADGVAGRIVDGVVAFDIDVVDFRLGGEARFRHRDFGHVPRRIVRIVGIFVAIIFGVIIPNSADGPPPAEMSVMPMTVTPSPPEIVREAVGVVALDIDVFYFRLGGKARFRHRDFGHITRRIVIVVGIFVAIILGVVIPNPADGPPPAEMSVMPSVVPMTVTPSPPEIVREAVRVVAMRMERVRME